MKHNIFAAMMRPFWAFAFCTLCSVQPALAEDHQILMLNFGQDGGMVFDPGYLKVSVGDTITFIPENTSHYVKTRFAPDGADEWQSKLDEKYSVTIEKEGVYVYYCPPHLMMSMVGVIQAGSPVNKEVVMAEMPGFARRMLQNKGRLDRYLDQIED